ncbi:MAG TPA: 2Fe-2S iron-sulfur cluster-binding protein [Syntrophorhabdales bacterium]|nr:2Fe-2S iron-sulfur cluster-binding protein [Syntrophorhabdales bacterium]
MHEMITARVFRFDPDSDSQPRYQEYLVSAEEETSVLTLLNKIQLELDPTLSFRSFCCGLQMCGSCLMRIDGKRRFACITLVKPGATITVDPLTFPEGHIKDLVCEVAGKETEEERA